MKTELEAQYPEASVEVWAFDEHRLGLKPILRKVWSPIGERPIARINHQYDMSGPISMGLFIPLVEKPSGLLSRGLMWSE
ncbi:MAG: hypothetical protein F6K09_11715 [Merismopedia sp. SIO2A8]|nr:hypothetical protein [Merismopedia sp. SIO2A8]